MYSNKESVNILTALLVKHGVSHAVVCPGSRNAPIVHNLNECPDIQCHPVTDERSAAFYALGMSQALDSPVAVCVTSGSALLNVMPATAEAYYQHVPLVVISADRPPQWIGQLDGQTLPQPGTLEPFVAASVTLPEPHDAESRCYCNRLVNEALLAMNSGDCRPVHINVPLSEPLFTFDVAELPAERTIGRYRPQADYSCLPAAFLDGFFAAQRPMIVFGQSRPGDFEGCGLDCLFSHVIVLHEALAPFPSTSLFDDVLGHDDMAHPDFIIYVGNCIVSKRLRHFLREAEGAVSWRISPSGDVEDTFCNLRGVIVGDADFVLQALDKKMHSRNTAHQSAYRRQWLHALSRASERAASFEPPFSQMAAVKALEAQLPEAFGKAALSAPPPVCEGRSDEAVFVHYANSSAIRLANIYARHHVWCNRGVNGIEGSLSTAAGFSVATSATVVCVIGDLSFFYDQNALWNRNLRGNLRILLLNNGCGGIFSRLPGLEQSPARDGLVAGRHQTSAEGICRQNGVDYLAARDSTELQQGIARLLSADAPHPVLLEVLTDPVEDERALRMYSSERA